MSGLTFAEKALARAAGLPEVRAGAIVEARPDRILTHDNTAAIAEIFYKEMGAERLADPEQACITLDHASPPPTPKHAQNHAETRAFVKAQGVRHFFEVGRGICHQVLSEEALVLPGDLILGADSHTTHFGWLGAFGAGVGRTEAAVLWATGKLWLRVPESVRINLLGSLPPGVTAKDICLHINKVLGADGGLYYSMEFSGPGVGALSLESRMVIPNSMAEIGVKNAWLPPDQAVLDYLGARGIAPASLEARALFPDPDAVYAAEYDLHLDRLEPLVACPHSVDNVQPLSAAAGQRVDMAFIGTCTNGRLEDLAAAAEVLRGRRVDPGTRLLVIPASSQVYQQALREGLIEILVEAGAVIGVPGCGPCMGNHLGIPAKGETVISAANRNFRGRMGQPEAGIFLASPAVVAASAVLGRIGGPAELQGGRKPLTTKDTKGTKGHKETMELKTHSPHSSIRSIRVESSRTDAQVPTVASEARQPTSAASGASGRTWKYGDNVNTDQIFPGKYTYTVTAPEEIAAHAMEDLDPGFASEVRAGDVVFGGSNFGCGSSREQAVTCLKHKGVAALVAESFARIFFRNAINQGLPAIVSPEAVAAARVGDPVQVDLDAGLIRLPAATYAFPAFPPNVQEILKAGGLVEYMRARAR